MIQGCRKLSLLSAQSRWTRSWLDEWKGSKATVTPATWTLPSSGQEHELHSVYEQQLKSLMLRWVNPFSFHAGDVSCVCVFSLFSCSSVLDSMLFIPTKPQDAHIQNTLLYDIVNPLRKCVFCCVLESSDNFAASYWCIDALFVVLFAGKALWRENTSWSWGNSCRNTDTVTHSPQTKKVRLEENLWDMLTVKLLNKVLLS